MDSAEISAVQEALVARPSSRAEFLERLRLLVESHVPHIPVDRKLFRDFVFAVLKSVDVGYFERSAGPDLIEVLEDTLEFIAVRVQDQICVRVRPGTPAVLESCMRDQPFVYDSLRLLLDQEEVTVLGGFHAVIGVARTEEGQLSGVGAPGMPLESVIHLEVEGVETAERAAALEESVRKRLTLARSAVRDFPKMVVTVEELMNRYQLVARTRPATEAEALLEARKFLAWLLDHHFVFMALAYIPAAGEDSPIVSGLGTHRLEASPQDPIDRALTAAKGPPFVRVRKSHALSRIHRAGRLDHVLVRCFDTQGSPLGLAVFEGLFTYRALARPAAEIPMSAPVLVRLLEEAGLPPDAYRARLLRYAFSALPLEFLFMAPYEDVVAVVDRILGAAEGRGTEVAYSVERAQGAAYVFVAMPRAEYDEELRVAIEELVTRSFGASVTDYGVSAGVLETVVLPFFLSGAELRPPELDTLRTEVLHLMAPWRERLRVALQRRFEPPYAERLLARYEDAFPEEYRRVVPPSRTVADIEHLEALLGGKPMSFDLFRDEVAGRPADPLLRIYELEDVLLSELLPVLDHFGLLVVNQFETKVYLPGGKMLSVDTFRLGGVRGVPGADVMAARERLIEALEAVFAGRFTDSPLNALLMRTEMTWRDVGMFRSYLAYARQLGFRFSPGLVQEVLIQNAEAARVLAHIFRIKFDPRSEGGPEQRALALAKARGDYLQRLAAISDYAADSILRSLLNLVDATVRTNLYCRNERTDNLALKFNCEAIELMAPPRPAYEIFVHHVAVEGVHLRGGKVARGGIRWSDRIDDYRTEVLGLMRTQMVKNAIIIPVGAKGGFVLHRPAENPKERRAQADAAYRLFVSALLDVTDNLTDGTRVPPPDVVCYDDADPYLVVAADKGTAHLSDTANEISEQRSFWLHDAFASGGSYGYDHKATGITARGAWVCARRHLREIGIDPDRDTISVIGIGDMSGDVFGNGLLSSLNFRLIAAFDHRHIFLDPQPDPVVSYAERQRLFRLPGSSWADYDPAKISAGGGVFSRAAKEVPLSPELQQRFGIARASLSGEDMIRAILTLDVELLWNGGIGTYIKASAEDHREVGDRANDMVRVDGKDVRAKVIAEGGNLGVTQLGRLEYAQRGGKINIDAIDNSGGVDLSDHEVNLKILFEPLCRSGELSRDERNRLLEEAKEEVVQRVLENNDCQSRLLSLDQRRSRREALRFARTIRLLARSVPFDARGLRLPDERTLRARAQEGEGMLRPELSLLAGYTKIYVKRQLLQESVIDPRSPRFWPILLSYFPRGIAERFKARVASHLLSREIGITMLANRLVDDAGLTIFPELQDWSGHGVSAVAAAYLAASEVTDAWELKEELRAVEKRIPIEVAYRAFLRVEDGLEQGAALLLSGMGGGTLECPPGAREILRALPHHLPAESAARYEAAASELSATGLPEALARRVAGFDFLLLAMHASSSAEQTHRLPVEAFSRFFATGEASRLLELERRIAVLPADGRSDAGALRTMRYRFLSHLAELVRGEDGQVSSRAGSISSEVGKLLAEDLNVAALVTLEDRVQRIANA
jgi:glutamate dehydrogenase